MKLSELKLIPKEQNVKIAKRIRALAKSAAKEFHGDEGETPHGWGAGPHQGTGDNPRITR